MWQDPAVTVGLPLDTGELLLIWTTTPWTLPSNQAVAVGPDLDYVVVEHEGCQFVIAEARLAAYSRELGEDVAERIVRRLKGSESWSGATTCRRSPTSSATRAPIGSWPPTSSAPTRAPGVVHELPAFGEEDMTVCQANGITAVVPVDEAGRFTGEVADYAGLQVFAGQRRDHQGPEDAYGG